MDARDLEGGLPAVVPRSVQRDVRREPLPRSELCSTSGLGEPRASSHDASNPWPRVRGDVENCARLGRASRSNPAFGVIETRPVDGKDRLPGCLHTGEIGVFTKGNGRNDNFLWIFAKPWRRFIET